MEEGKFNVKGLYAGGYSSLSPSYGDIFTGYRASAENIGMTTDARSANVVKALSDSISKGTKTIEVGSISPEVFDSIPTQQLKEVNRLSKLTGVDVTVHAPVVEPSGMGQQGFTESTRQEVERQMNSFVERAHEMSPDGNVPVTFHSTAGLPGQIIEKGKELEETYVINSETGSTGKLPVKKRKWPGEEKPTVEQELAKINEDQWTSGKRNILYYTDMGEDAINKSRLLAQGQEGIKEEEQARTSFQMGKGMLDDTYRQLKDQFEMANNYGSSSDKRVLKKFYDAIQEDAKIIQKNPKDPQNAFLQAKIIRKGVEAFEKLENPPQVYKSLNTFAKDKTTETFSNVALNSFKKFKDKAPIISIENPPAGSAFSTGKELKEVVEESRQKFVEKAIKSQSQGGLGLSSSQAKEEAAKLLGVTWDVGHINMMRKYGSDSKDIIKETEAVAPLVKHIHLSDNFGFEHTELPMGMGNVPIKEMMEKLPEKDVKKVIEAISWYQHFQAPAVTETFEAFGSPTGSGTYWNQAMGGQQDYYSGMGSIFPQINYETFGGSYSQLPMELGGQRPGAQGSRMSGTPME